MTLPPELMERVAEAIGMVQEEAPLPGGCIGSARRVVVNGEAFFLKYGRGAGEGFFAAEAAGLEALRSAAGRDLRIPAVVAHRDVGQGRAWGWILLEWLDPVPPTTAHWSRLGEGLARLHRAGADDGWGWERNGFIGSLPQSNEPAATWAEFWAERRLGPQLERARSSSSGIGSSAEWDRLFAALPRLLEPAESDRPSFVHGDLWSGNVLMTAAGPAIVDPAFHRGHREVDLAMAALFGGFPPAFRASYEQTWPIQPGYDVREGVYRLYYLLVHVNLFGSSYAQGTVQTLRSVLAAV